MIYSKCCKLIETLRTFSHTEFNSFEKIASSNYFSKGRNHTPYIKALKKYYPAFEGEDFCKNNARKYIFNIVHPGKRYNDQYMKNIFRGNLTVFMKYYKKLINLAEGKENEPEIVLNELKKTSAFPERRWLLENIKDIVKQK